MSLFTTFPVKLAAEIAHNCPISDVSLEDQTTLSEIVTLFGFRLNAACLAYRGDFFQQIFDTSMGSPVSVTVANLVMENVE